MPGTRIAAAAGIDPSLAPGPPAKAWVRAFASAAAAGARAKPRPTSA